MSGYYNSGNNDYDDLEAPVWGDTDENRDSLSNNNAVNELSQTFANINALGTPNNDITDDEEDDQKLYTAPDQTYSVATEDVTHNIQSGQNHDNLLAKLAPEDNSLTKLDKTDINLSMPKTEDDPLFSGSMFASPLKIDNDSYNQSENGINHSGVLSKSGSTKPQQLFNWKRIRRRPATVSPIGNDPLGKAQKANEFVDEDINDNENNINQTKSNSNSDILKQMESPLYQLSPRKDSIQDVDVSKESQEADKIETHEQQEINSEVEEPVEKKEELIPFKIEVKDPVKIDEMTTSHVEYAVETQSSLIPNGYVQIRRRYRDFRWLYRQLQNNYWGQIIPPPPEKQAVGRFKDDFIESRRFQMERMLNKIANNPILQKDDDFLFFLSSDSFVKDSKIREYITGSCASNDNNDLSEIHISEIQLLGAEDAALVMKNGGLDTENNKGFMNLSFSSPPKYIEQDPFFLDEYDKLSVLSEQLKQLSKSLDLIDTQRNELGSVVEEFANMIKSLANLEVTKQTSGLLYNFADVQDKMKLILERYSIQDSLTVVATVDEYIRSLASVRATDRKSVV